jgi:hypothetical protein
MMYDRLGRDRTARRAAKPKTTRSTSTPFSQCRSVFEPPCIPGGLGPGSARPRHLAGGGRLAEAFAERRVTRAPPQAPSAVPALLEMPASPRSPLTPPNRGTRTAQAYR